MIMINMQPRVLTSYLRNFLTNGTSATLSDIHLIVLYFTKTVESFEMIIPLSFLTYSSHTSFTLSTWISICACGPIGILWGKLVPMFTMSFFRIPIVRVFHTRSTTFSIPTWDSKIVDIGAGSGIRHENLHSNDHVEDLRSGHATTCTTNLKDLPSISSVEPNRQNLRASPNFIHNE